MVGWFVAEPFGTERTVMFQIILADDAGARYETTYALEGNPLLFANDFVLRCEWISEVASDIHGYYRNVWLEEINKI